MIQESVFFGVFISILAYQIGLLIKKKINHTLINPLLISIVLVIIVLLVGKIDYNVYYEGAKYISYFLTPATVCLAVPLYEEIESLKNDWRAILAGITAGVLTSLCCIFLLSLVFKMDHQMYVTLLPKSITSAIGMSISEELGGIPSITVPVIVITGITGNVFSDIILKVFRITDPVAKGIGIGTASHAIGTSHAIELGDVEGAMGGLSIAVAGIITVILAPLFANLL